MEMYIAQLQQVRGGVDAVRDGYVNSGVALGVWVVQVVGMVLIGAAVVGVLGVGAVYCL